MPYKRKNSKFYRLKLKLPAYGDTGQLSCRVTSKTIARRMEDLMRRIAEKGLMDPSWHKLLDAVCAGEITLPELLRAKNEKRLEQLRRMAQDPTLEKAITQYEATDPNYITGKGLDLLKRMAEREFGERPRFSLLRSGKNITLLCHRARREGSERGDGTLKHNSVRRTLLLSTSKLISFHLGNAKRDEIFADVDFAREDDGRDVWLAPGQLRRLLHACVDWFRPFVLTAVSVGADRSPLLRMLARDVEIFFDQAEDLCYGVIFLRDSKTDTRPRSVAIVDPVCRALLPLVGDKDPDEKVFEGPPDPGQAQRQPLTPGQVRYWFEQAREAAGLEHVRFKDLRHTWGVTADRAGLSLGKMQAGMGHKLDETTLRYLKRQVRLERHDAEKVAREMGLVAGAEERPSKTG